MIGLSMKVEIKGGEDICIGDDDDFASTPSPPPKYKLDSKSPSKAAGERPVRFIVVVSVLCGKNKKYK